MSDNIKLVRLTSGEELLAKVKSESRDEVVVEDACIIIPQGSGNLGIMQYIPYASYKTLPIKGEHVMFILTPKTDLLNEYNKVFGSGLIQPKEKKIII
jgi:hypothetical protein